MTYGELWDCCCDQSDVINWLINFAKDVCGQEISDSEIEKYLYTEAKEIEEESHDEDSHVDISDLPQRKSRRDRRRNDALKKKKAKAISETGGFFNPYYPVDKHGNHTDNEDDIAYYKRQYESSNRTKFLKRQSNKAIRKMDVEDDVALSGGDYKKVYDYQWELH